MSILSAAGRALSGRQPANFAADAALANGLAELHSRDDALAACIQSIVDGHLDIAPPSGTDPLSQAVASLLTKLSGSMSRDLDRIVDLSIKGSETAISAAQPARLARHRQPHPVAGGRERGIGVIDRSDPDHRTGRRSRRRGNARQRRARHVDRRFRIDGDGPRAARPPSLASEKIVDLERGIRGDRDHRGLDRCDRQTDQSAGAECHHRGGSRRRGRQRLCRGGDRGEEPVAADQPRHRGHPDPHRPAARRHPYHRRGDVRLHERSGGKP